MFKLPVNESKTIQETQLKCIDSLKTLNLLLSAWGGGFPTCQRTVYNMDREKSKYYNNSLMFNMTEQLLPLGGEVFPHGIHKPSI